MKMMFTAMAAACALGAAAPAAAQYVNANAGGAVGISNRIAQLESRLDAGIRAGVVDRNEAFRLRGQLSELRRLERIYGRNGLSVQERSDLQARIRDVRANIRLADGGRFDRDTRYGAAIYDGPRYDRYGNRDDNGMYDRNGNRIDVNGSYGTNVYSGPRYDRYGNRDDNGMYDRNGNRIDVNGSYGTNVYSGPRYDRYGNRDDNGMYDRNGNRIDVNGSYGTNVYSGPRYDRNGNRDDNGMYDRNGNRIDNGYYGQGGPYEEADDACDDRGGIGGVIDDVLGRGCTNLRVGSRVTSNLGAVPYEYRNQFRDGNGYYYRSDGRSIYQIDVRTNTVVRIYSMNR